MRAAIGGVFLATSDPERLMQWFEALGIVMERFGSGGAARFEDGEAFSVLGVMRARPGAPEPPEGGTEREPYGRQPMMLNVRVSDLDEAVGRLRGAGSVVVGPEPYEAQGRFAWTRTPDGHDVELWEPGADR